MNIKNKIPTFSKPIISHNTIMNLNIAILSTLTLINTYPKLNPDQYIKTDEDAYINTKMIRWSKEECETWKICMKNSGCAYDNDFFHVSESLNKDSYHKLDKIFDHN